MYDSLEVLQALATKVTAFNSTAIDTISGTSRRGLKARFIVASYSSATAGNVFTPAIDHSDDNTTFTRLAAGTPLTCATATASAVVFVPFETSKRYIRCALDLSASTASPTITYTVDLGTARPG